MLSFVAIKFKQKLINTSLQNMYSNNLKQCAHISFFSCTYKSLLITVGSTDIKLSNMKNF